MKKLIQKAINAAKIFLKWVWAECKDWHTLALLGVVCVVLSSPIWVCYILGFIFGWEWAFIVATAVWAFWWLPGAPFFALAVSITLGIKKIYEKKQEKEDKASEEEKQKNGE